MSIMPNQMNVELLLGKKVIGPNNRKIGRIEEIRAELLIFPIRVIQDLLVLQLS